MKKLFVILSLMALNLFIGNTLLAQCNASYNKSQKATAVASSQANSDNDIVTTLVNSKQHTTLVAAVKAAKLVSTLQGEGPFTVFAPVNDAFENLPAGTVEALLKPENSQTLTKVLTYHVIAGKFDAASIVSAIRKGNGKAVLTTVSGDQLTAMMNGDRNVILKDESGNTANISTYDVQQSNGVVHVIDTVVLPN